MLNVAVTEQSTGDYGVTAGLRHRSRAFWANCSLTERNFLGRGQYVKASIGASQTGQQLRLLVHRALLHGPQDVGGHRSSTTTSSDETATNVYGTTSTGGQLRFGLPVTRDVSGSVFTGIDQTIVRRCQRHRRCGAVLHAPTAQAFQQGWVGYSLNYNGLDDQTHPTEGLYAQLTQQYDGHRLQLRQDRGQGSLLHARSADAGIVGSLEGQAGIINTFGGWRQPDRSLPVRLHPGAWLPGRPDGAALGRRGAGLHGLRRGRSAEVAVPDPDAAGNLPG